VIQQRWCRAGIVVVEEQMQEVHEVQEVGGAEVLQRFSRGAEWCRGGCAEV